MVHFEDRVEPDESNHPNQTPDSWMYENLCALAAQSALGNTKNRAWEVRLGGTLTEREKRDVCDPF